ncbi:orotate phosphoribosyltransferase [Fusibacter bizertensis]|uniref:Orotate phosphoribosyltransferase n=1 Tax=Fusibacter bizertensis TaxID=1488331 RepID=A0ABT6NGR2_9FIRM|nr:orotate phosphoribosyltransferase [Fusibacter bizertensis]MDH8679626.1 orotate phosphoribosyltransferase [Fusibacter bizertensis]
MLAREIAESLLKIKAVTIVDEKNLFTWVSGIKSPVYCDNRMTISYPEVREKIANGFVEIIKEKFPDVEIIAGTATAGIPHAAWVAQKLNLPMVYVRSSAKEHGKGKQTEGVLTEGAKVVLIEDLLSTGGSSIKACEALTNEGANVMGTLAIFSYNFSQVDQLFSERNIPYITLTDYRTLLPIAVEMGYVPNTSLETLIKWSENPKMFTKE